MAASVRVEINQAGINAVLTSSQVAAHVTMVAARGAGLVKARGANRKGEIVSTPARRRGATLQATFGSTSSFWHLEEFGSVNNGPYRSLTNAANSLGLRLEMSGR